MRPLFVGFGSSTVRGGGGLARDWTLGHRNISAVDTGDVVDARPPSVFVHRIESNEILLSMASHLGWSPCHHKVPRNASPIALSVFVQPQKEQSVLDKRNG